MLILWKERLAILAVPKTGTTALEEALAPHAAVAVARPPHLKHMPLRRFDRFIRPWLAKSGLENIETVAVMREPLSWLGSWYRYRRRDQIRGSERSTAGVTFDQFIDAYLMGEDRPEYANVGAQLRMIAGADGAPGVDHLFAYENLGALREFLQRRTGRAITLGRSNVSPEMPLALEAAREARLRRALAADFAAWSALA